MKYTIQAAVVRLEAIMRNEDIDGLRIWKERGTRLAVYTPSGGVHEALEQAGIEDLFEVRLDQMRSDEKTKPGPELLLTAAEELGVSPQEAWLIEGDGQGIKAGKKAGFSRVVGLTNSCSRDQLLRSGADWAVNNLQELDQVNMNERNPAGLPSALKSFDHLSRTFGNTPPLLFLDFDGTLSPIVEHHNDAVISDDMRRLVQELASYCPIAVVSGRGLNDVKKRMALPQLFYAGSHGFEISGPGGFGQDHEEALKLIPLFDRIEPKLREQLASFPGVEFERKKFTLAVHYRQVDSEREQEVHRITSKILAAYPNLSKTEGKKVIEIRPSIDWHKGRAVHFLEKQLSKEEYSMSVYLGDDITDEDAFEYLSSGIGILVGDHGRKTYANYQLEDLDQVKQFFISLLEYFAQEKTS